MIYFYSFFSTSNCERLQEVLLIADMPGESIYKLGSGMYIYNYIYNGIEPSAAPKIIGYIICGISPMMELSHDSWGYNGWWWEASPVLISLTCNGLLLVLVLLLLLLLLELRF